MVEFFSPSCPHCMHFKPTYQTAYEFYYTSKPIVSKDDTEGDSLNSFTRYYDFKFAKVDCQAFADACAAHNVMNYPSLYYFKDGKMVQKEVGAKEMGDLSKWVEQLLEAIRPGSRKEGGPKLPKAGANSVETGPDTEEAVKEKEKEVAKAVSATAKSTPTKASKPALAKPTSTPNPAGEVVALTSESYDKVVANNMDPWFIKFYAPWCHHCQALAPNWSNLARQMRGNLNIGEVNCDAEKALCKKAGVHGYPTMLLFRGAERAEYDGLRGIGDLLSYAEKVAAVGAGVQDVEVGGDRGGHLHLLPRPRDYFRGLPSLGATYSEPSRKGEAREDKRRRTGQALQDLNFPPTNCLTRRQAFVLPAHHAQRDA
jgi:protein disulfide-isomerase